MCDDYYDDSEPCHVWDEIHPVARKSHPCHGCGESILPGHRYRRSAALYDGSWSTWKHCGRCATLIDALKDRMGEYTTDMLDLNCGEVWDEPPPDVEALAFALPGELTPPMRPG